MKNINLFVTLQSYNVDDYQPTKMYMKKMTTFAAIGLLVLASCSKSTDLYQPPVEPEIPTPNANVQKVFGTTFDPNHDWCTTVNGKVTILVNSSIKTVQVLVYLEHVDEDGEPYTSMEVLNAAEVDGRSSITLTYDAPKVNNGLFVAFISDTNYQLAKVEGETVSLNNVAKTRSEGDDVEETPYTLPNGTFTIGKSIESYANTRGWVPGEMLYELDSYTAQKMTVPNYSEEMKTAFKSMVLSYFQNKQRNLQKVKSSGLYNDKVYPITTGDKPIIVMPAFKWDSGSKYGNEIYNSDLYYYYFDTNAPEYQSNPVAFLQSLPKYKAFPFNEYYTDSEDNIIRRTAAYALMYFGDSKTPAIDTEGSFTFPKGLSIGFMVRANTEFEEDKPGDPVKKIRKQGELYGDGRLNNDINNDPVLNFSSSKLDTDGPRVAWLTLNGRKLMCWESGTDADFNDIIIDVEGGIEIPFVPVDPEYKNYTYCFEDTPVGDYDLNDVVIKAVRKSETTVEYYVTACGAYDEIYIKGIGIDNNEVHKLLTNSSDTKVFINTQKGGQTASPYKVTKQVEKSFSLIDPTTAPYLYDATTKTEIYLSRTGEDPHGIMIPNDFKYPLEKTCIKDAYSEFNNWGQSSVTSTDWYTKPVTGKVY